MVRNIKVKLGFEKLPQARQAYSESRIPYFLGGTSKQGKDIGSKLRKIKCIN